MVQLAVRWSPGTRTERVLGLFPGRMSLPGGRALSRTLLAAWLGGCLLLSHCAPVMAADGPPIVNYDASAHLDLSGFAVQLKDVLTKIGEDTVSLGDFRGPPNFPSSYGPQIQKVLGDALQAVGITIKRNSQYAIEARYFLVDVEAAHSNGDSQVVPAIRLDVSIIDARSGQVKLDLTFLGKGSSGGSGGKAAAASDPAVVPDKLVIQQGTFSTFVVDSDSVTQMVGVPAVYPPSASPAEKSQLLKEYIEVPPVYFQSQSGKAAQPASAVSNPAACTRLVASPDSPFSIEILVNGQPRPFTVVDGLPFVELKSDDIYEIKAFSKAPFESAVRANIDGVNVFEFSTERNATGQPRFNQYIIGPNDSATFRGWFIDTMRVDSFKITGYADSAAARIQSSQNLGMITVCFHAAWDAEGGTPPADEVGTKGSAGATGFGPPVKQVTKPVKKKIGALRASITVRYTK